MNAIQDEVQNLIARAYSYDPSGHVVQRHSVKSGFPVADFTTAYDGYGQQLGCISQGKRMGMWMPCMEERYEYV